MQDKTLDQMILSLSIPQTPIHIEKLLLLADSEKVLRTAGYITRPLDSEVIEAKKRCRNCGARIQKRKARAKRAATGVGRGRGVRGKGRDKEKEKENEEKKKEVKDLMEFSDHETGDEEIPKSEKATESLRKAVQDLKIDDDRPPRPGLCRFHPGRAYQKYFSCCQQHVSSDGCTVHEQHTVRNYASGELEREWLYKDTPNTPPQPQKAPHQLARHTRAQREFFAAQTKRKAVAMDCEMGTSMSGEPELIRLTLIDFFTGEILIDSLVSPTVPMLHYNTRHSGVSVADMRKAERSGSCIRGRDAARKCIWTYLESETVLVMHGGQSDLSVLRWIHPVVVDSLLLERFVEPIEGGKSLKNLAAGRLGREIQNGKKGHCSLEDALACRELVHWHACQIPDS